MGLRRAQLALGFVVSALCAAVPTAASAQDIGCDPGDLEVSRVDFVGNRTFDDAELANGLVTTPSSWARRVLRKIGTQRCLDTLEVQRDPLRLLVLYRRRGFPSATISARIDTVRPSTVAVTFRIQEGDPIVIEQLVITGLDSVPRAERFTADLPIRVGGRFDQIAMEATRDTILRRLRDNGYPNADLLRSYESDVAKLVATVKFDVASGPRARIGAINVKVTPRKGETQEISDNRVRSTLGFESGDLYRERELEGAKRALYLSQAYRHVELGPDTASLRPAGDSTIDVDITLAESFMRSIRPSAGWGTLDCFRAQIDYSDYAFFGALRRLDINARASKIGVGYPTKATGNLSQICAPSVQEDIYSDTLNYYVGTTLAQSSLFGVRAVPTITLYSALRSEYHVFNRYTPIGAVLTLSQQLRGRIGATYAYQLEYGRTSAEPALFCGVFGICDADEQAFLKGMQRVATASVTFGRDRRNDPFYPSAGSYISLELRTANQLIGSDPNVQFNRVVADGSWFWALPRRSVLAARIRGGVVFGRRLVLGEESPTFIPQQERLYAGGANSVRGYQQNELGPVVYLPDEMKVCIAPTGACVTPETAMDTVYFSSDPEGSPRVLPVGGNSVAVANLELRMPSPFIPDRLQVAFFADAGQVWTRGASGAERSFGSLRITPGFGMRLASPVGPIRVDVGFNPYDRVTGAAYFNASEQNDVAPLYCVSPGNGLPVTGWKPTYDDNDLPAVQANPSRGCPISYEPKQKSGFFSRLRLNVSIGQAF